MKIQTSKMMKYYLLMILIVVSSCKDKEKVSIPKGKDCDVYFPQDAMAQSKKNNNFFINERRSIYTGDEGILLTNLLIKDTKFHLAINILNGNKVICIKENSLLGVRIFENNNTHLIKGDFDRNCKQQSDPKGNGAIGLFEVPLNSTLFKELLTKKVGVIGVGLDNVNALFKPLDQETALDLQNAARCAYDAFGGEETINLSNDNLLIDTVYHVDKPND